MLRDREQIMMEDRGWDFSDDDRPVKIDGNGREVGSEGDAIWAHDLAEVRSLL